MSAFLRAWGDSCANLILGVFFVLDGSPLATPSLATFALPEGDGSVKTWEFGLAHLRINTKSLNLLKHKSLQAAQALSNPRDRLILYQNIKVLELEHRKSSRGRQSEFLFAKMQVPYEEKPVWLWIERSYEELPATLEQGMDVDYLVEQCDKVTAFGNDVKRPGDLLRALSFQDVSEPPSLVDLCAAGRAAAAENPAQAHYQELSYLFPLVIYCIFKERFTGQERIGKIHRRGRLTTSSLICSRHSCSQPNLFKLVSELASACQVPLPEKDTVLRTVEQCLDRYDDVRRELDNNMHARFNEMTDPKIFVHSSL